MSRHILLVAKRGPLVTRDRRIHCPDPECPGRIDQLWETRDRVNGYQAEGRCDTCGEGYYECEGDQDDE